MTTRASYYLKYEDTMREEKQTLVKRSYSFVWLFLTIVGIAGGLLSFQQEQCTKLLYLGRKSLLNVITNPILKFATHILYNMLLILLALFLTSLAPTSQGSGVAPVKAFLAGAPIKEPLSPFVLLVKLISAPLTMGAQFFLGRVDGHIGAALAASVSRIPIFRRIQHSELLLPHLVACGLALGVGANFGTPASGMLFAMEVIGSYYPLRLYMRSFYVTILAVLVSRSLSSAVAVSPTILPVWSITMKSHDTYEFKEFFLFMFLGVVLGILGYLMIKIYKFMFVALKKSDFSNRLLCCFPNTKNYWFTRCLESYAQCIATYHCRQYLWAICVGLMVAICTYAPLMGEFMALDTKAALEDLCSDEPLSNLDNPRLHAKDWLLQSMQGSVLGKLAIFFWVRLMVSLLCFSLPLPGGLYTPSLVIGAAFGRLYGELVKQFLIDTVVPGGYAIVGAAALTGSITHTFSTSFILLEVTGTSFHIPTLMTVFISVGVCRTFSTSVYDTTIKLQNWSALLAVSTDNETILARDLMESNFVPYIKQHCTKEEVQIKLEAFRANKFAVVDNDATKLLMGAISREALQKWSTDEFATWATLPLKNDMALHEETPAIHLHNMFSSMRLKSVFVTNYGQLVGYITRERVKKLHEKKLSFLGKLYNRLYEKCFERCKRK